MKYYAITKPRQLRDEFLTTFDSMFDQMMNDFYPTVSKKINKDFFLKGSYPKCNVLSTENELIIEAAIPGMTKDDLKIDVESNVLSISGNSKNEDSLDSSSYLFREIKKSYFQRSFSLSDSLNTSEIKASVANGMLNITIPFLVPEKEEQNSFSVKID